MQQELSCWKCGTSIDAELQPLGRLSECPACRAQLHVCRMCTSYDPKVSKHCREPVAEDVQDKTRANFCGYFQPGCNAVARSAGQSKQSARLGLEALFGDSGQETGPGEPPPADAARNELERLFGATGEGKDS